jgi:hypothetical protein
MLRLVAIRRAVLHAPTGLTARCSWQHSLASTTSSCISTTTTTTTASSLSCSSIIGAVFRRVTTRPATVRQVLQPPSPQLQLQLQQQLRHHHHHTSVRSLLLSHIRVLVRPVAQYIKRRHVKVAASVLAAAPLFAKSTASDARPPVNEDLILEQWMQNLEDDRSLTFSETVSLIFRALQLALLFAPIILTYPIVHLLHFHLHVPGYASIFYCDDVDDDTSNNHNVTTNPTNPSTDTTRLYCVMVLWCVMVCHGVVLDQNSQYLGAFVANGSSAWRAVLDQVGSMGCHSTRPVLSFGYCRLVAIACPFTVACLLSHAKYASAINTSLALTWHGGTLIG